MKLGRLTQKAINKEFPDCWQALAAMLDIKYDLSDTGKSIILYFKQGSLTINDEDEIECTAPISRELITEVLIETLNNEKGDE